ncbi:MAG TPA: patatin-like phospholipase family protein [Nitrosarchaeum sp.]|nr:patatin-like phospholipase family protein [Nitrosarchaeum sp.]
MKTIPQEERALILQGGGSLGAYEAGAFSAAYSFLKYRNMEQKTDRPIFDIVAGTSIGAINAAILVSYVIEKIPWDFDGVVNRNIDIIFADKSKRDETIILLLSDFVDLSKKLIDIAKSHGVKQEIIDKLLDELPDSHGRLHDIKPLQYRNLVEGQFNIGEVIRIERKHSENETSKKIFDFSSNTIKQLIGNGYDDVVNYIDTRFGHQYLKAAGLQQGKNNHE